MSTLALILWVLATALFVLQAVGVAITRIHLGWLGLGLVGLAVIWG